jgi:cytochrome c peroxidase
MSARNIGPLPFLLIVLVGSSCQDDPTSLTANNGPSLPPRPFHYGVISDPTGEITTLGRVLFYDKSLSVTNDVSCGSCHKQSLAFSDDKAFSTGIYNQLTIRNTLPIMNLEPESMDTVTSHTGADGYGSAGSGRMLGGLFWDGRETSLQTMVLLPLSNPIEMGNGVMVSKIQNLPYYKPLFQHAFGNFMVTEDNVSRALTSFVLSIRSSNSRFDRYNDAIAHDKPTDNILTPLEIQGMELFKGTYNCNNCHQVEQATRTTPRFANIGLSNYADRGLSQITGNDGDVGKFRVPSLRNVEFTAPYMHNGSLATLEQVIQHYSDQIEDHPNLHPDLKDATGHARKMNISPDEVKALVAFLHTLSDESNLTDPKFSDPFGSN